MNALFGSLKELPLRFKALPGGAKAAVLGSHLFFQSEKSYNGGHYRNMMNAAYTQVGIGVWVSGGRVRLVVDFYHP